MEYEVIGGNTNPSLKDLNQKAIKTLYDLLDNLGPEGKGSPEMVTAVTDAISKLNTSLKNSGILPQEETAEEKAKRESADAIREALEV
jgi:hypothetical protein